MQTFRSALVGLPLVGLPLIGLPLVGVRLVRLQHQRGFLQYRQVRPRRGPASRPGSRVSIQRSKHIANDTVAFSGCVAGSSAVATCTPRFSGRQDQRVTYVEHASAYPSLPHCVDARFFGPVVVWAQYTIDTALSGELHQPVVLRLHLSFSHPVEHR